MVVPFFVGVLVITVLDQIAKFFAVAYLKDLGTIPIIEDVFRLTYCENPGAGFGVFANHTYLLSIVTMIIVAVAMWYVTKKRPQNRLLMTGLTFMIGGAVGNLIDRVRLGYVVDFLDFCLIDFPIFNIADCFVTIGAIIFAVYIIFYSEKKEQTDGEN